MARSVNGHIYLELLGVRHHNEGGSLRIRERVDGDLDGNQRVADSTSPICTNY